MKKVLLIILVLGLGVNLFAQIDPELLLELTKGTTAEMNAVSPEKGTLLYNTDDDMVYRYDGASWTSVSEDGDWTRIGNDQYSAVSGRVGIGLTNPSEKLEVKGNSKITDGHLYIVGQNPSLKLKGDAVSHYPQINFSMLDGSKNGRLRAYGAADALLYEFNNHVFRNYSGDELVRIREDGDVGIGTTTPIVHLNNNTSSIPADLEISTIGQTGVAGRTDLSLFSDMDGSNPANIFLQGKLSTGDYGWATWSFRGNHSLAEYKDWVDFGLNDGTATKEQVIRMNVLNGDVVFNEGNVGIGILSPSSKLHIMGDVQLGGSDTRLLRFRNSADNDHASLGLLNGGLVLSGHASANVATHEHLFINNQGNVGIGTIAPGGLLHLSSSSGDTKLIIEADSDDSNEDDNPILIFKQDGGIEESAIEQTHNELHIRNSISNGGGLVFDVGTVNGYENAAEAMRIIPSGNVGIGTNNPLEKFEVQGKIAHSGSLKSKGDNYTFDWMRFAEHEWGNSTVIGAGGNTILGGGEFSWVAQSNFITQDEKLVLGSDYNIVFFTNTQSGWDQRKNVMNLTNSGRVGINTDAPTVDLDVNGELRIRNIPAGGGSQWLVKDGSGNVRVQASDFRLKKNIISIENSLEKVMKLDGKYFDWKVDGRKDIGFVAQEVEKVLPELVSDTDDGYKALNYPQITAVLVNAVKELKKENDVLRKKIENQKYGMINASISLEGQVVFADNDGITIERIGTGKFFVRFKELELFENYSVVLSAAKTILPNGDPIYINLGETMDSGFEVMIQSVGKDRVIVGVDAAWSFGLKGKYTKDNTIEANIGSIQE